MTEILLDRALDHSYSSDFDTTGFQKEYYLDNCAEYMVSRRAMLAAITSPLTFPLSGCLSAALSNNPPTLGCIELINFDHRPHTVHIQAEIEGEEVLADSYEIDRREQHGSVQHTWVTYEWLNQSGHFRVQFRMDGDSEWQTIDSEDEFDHSVYQIVYRIIPNGNGMGYWESMDVKSYEEECTNSLIATSEEVNGMVSQNMRMEPHQMGNPQWQ